nr:hypothetical protein [uncultured Actinoplanes sp.]
MAGFEQLLATDPARRPHRLRGLDSTGTAFAVVDSVGRFVDIGLDPGWWPALGPPRVAAGLLEAVESARMKAALVPLITREHNLEAARTRLAEAYRLIEDAAPRSPLRTITGPRGLFRLHVRGGHIESADVSEESLTATDADRLAADAHDVLAELSRHNRWVVLDEWQH